MKHQDSDGCSKCLLRKWQRRCIALHGSAICAVGPHREPGGKSVAIFEARHSPGAFPQLLCPRAWPSANFKNVFAQFRAGQKPWNYLLPCHPPPVGRTTKPILEPIQDHVQSARENLPPGSEQLPGFSECDYRRPAQTLAIEEGLGFSAVRKQIGRRCRLKGFPTAGRVR